jgi:hypothetical protein
MSVARASPDLAVPSPPGELTGEALGGTVVVEDML